MEFFRIPGQKTKGIGKFEFRLQDYRDVNEIFDRMVVVGMIEHVGKKNFDEFFQIARRNLKDNGLFLVHTMGIHYHKIHQTDPWINKYIFPGGMLPYHTQLINSFYGKFIVEDWHNFGFNYYRTLMAWHENFQKNWPLLESKYDERFKRMFVYYLISSAALFKVRKLNLWQIVLSKTGFTNGYVSVR